MVNNDHIQAKTDLAWNKLYHRFETDGLLIKKETKARKTFLSSGYWLATSAAVACICILSCWIYFQNQFGSSSDLIVLQNEAGAPTLATMLEDGSVIYLSEQASIQFPRQFQSNKREILLNGDAFFEIEKDLERPFYIQTASALVEIIGTSFNIKPFGESSFALSVKSGEVKVTLGKPQKTVHIHAGESVTFNGKTLEMGKADTQIFDSYLKRIHFKDERLADVIQIINLNSKFSQINIDPDLSDRLLTFSFSGNDPESMAHLICLALDLKLTKDKNSIYISAKK